MVHITHGIDISKWQGVIDWDKIAAARDAGDVDFVIMRAGYGYATTDPRFEEYYREAIARGIPCGAYWYAYWSAGTPKQEAEAFLAAVAGKSLAYGIWYDVEYESSITGLDKATRTDKTLEALDTLAASGRYVGLYASTDMINNRMDYDRLRAYDVWAAQYGSVCTCKLPYGMWQYTSTGSVNGIGGRVDRDYAYKDYPGIVVGQLAAGPATTNPAPVPDPGDTTPPRDTTVTQTDPMSRGDLRDALALAFELNLDVIGSLAIGPKTEGDTKSVHEFLDSRCVGYEEV